jgi:hypothetical protein
MYFMSVTACITVYIDIAHHCTKQQKAGRKLQLLRSEVYYLGSRRVKKEPLWGRNNSMQVSRDCE